MRHEAPRALPDLSKASHAELRDGSRGVFAGSWNDAKQTAPKAWGFYLVVVEPYEPVVGFYGPAAGRWDLMDTIHTGLEARITHWMELPKAPKRRL
jgi:hypothetical protein